MCLSLGTGTVRLQFPLKAEVAFLHGAVLLLVVILVSVGNSVEYFTVLYCLMCACPVKDNEIQTYNICLQTLSSVSHI